MAFKIGPEQPCEGEGDAFEAGVVQARLLFAQVVDDQVPDRLVAEMVTVDEGFDAALAGGTSEHPDRGWGLGAEDTGVEQQLIEVRFAGAALGMNLALQIEEL